MQRANREFGDGRMRGSFDEEQGHSVCMGLPHLRVGLQNQFPAVPVPLPFGDHLDVDAPLNCSDNEHSPEASMIEIGKFKPLAGARNALLGVFYLEHTVVHWRISLAFKSFQ